MQVSKTIRFEAAHRLQNHMGACSNIHGHSYKLEVTLEGMLTASAMVLDFGDLSRIVKALVNEGIVGDRRECPFDHAILLEENDPLLAHLQKTTAPQGLRIRVMEKAPTAEHMAEVFAREVQEALDWEGKMHARVRGIRLWETETSCVTWSVYEDKE